MKPYYEESGITIYHGDARDVLPSVESGTVRMLFMDPPYGHENHVDDLNSRLNEHRSLKDKPIANDGAWEMRHILDFVLWQSVRVLCADCCCCCCCCCGGGPSPTFAWVAARMDSSGLRFFHSVIWDKVNPGLGWRYRRQHEMVMVAHRVGAKLSWANEKAAVPNIMQIGPPRARLHPNEKPLPLVARFVTLHAVAGDLVLDPFMGSGTTLVAAKAHGCRAIGIELSEEHCEVAAKRLRQDCLFADTGDPLHRMTDDELRVLGEQDHCREMALETSMRSRVVFGEDA